MTLVYCKRMSQVQESEATYHEVGPPPIAQDQAYDMENNICYGSSRVIPKNSTSVNTRNRESDIDSAKVNAEYFNVEDNSAINGYRESATK